MAKRCNFKGDRYQSQKIWYRLVTRCYQGAKTMIFRTISLVATSLVSATLFAAAGAIAQITPAPTLSEQTLREAQQQERSSLSVGGSDLNLLQLINNINLAGGKSPEQFRASQAESFDEAVTNFRSQQRREVKIEIPTANTPAN
jgi:hypothetical protein